MLKYIANNIRPTSSREFQECLDKAEGHTLKRSKNVNRKPAPWCCLRAAVAEWLSSWLAEQEDRGSIPGLAT